MQTSEGVSKATIERLPAYLRYLKGEAGKGISYLSSAVVAKDMGISAVGVRKDLAFVSSGQGKPRMGFEVKQLIVDIEHFLGYHRRDTAVIVGAGGLGRALLAYEGFENYGFDVVAAFDRDPSKIGSYGGKTIYPLERIEEIVRRFDVGAGILTVPKEAAQEVTNTMVNAGIRAILNFAPVYLTVPENVFVKYEDLAVSLAALSGALSK